MEVSIIIVNYNTYQILKDCLDSVYTQTKEIKFEVIIVDNASQQIDRDNLKKEESRAKIFYLNKNIGFGRANNYGIERSCGKYIFLLNSDTILQNNAVKLFKDKMDSMNSDVACIGTYLLDKNNEITHSYGRFPTIFNCSYKFLLGSYARRLGLNRQYENYDLEIKEKEVEYITGAALFMRRVVGDKLGYFDPRFFLYYEETDMLKNYAVHGYKSIIIPEPRINHLCGSSSSGKSFAEKQLLPMMSHFVYLKKWNNYIYYIMYKILYILIVSLNILLLPRKQRDINFVYLKAAFLKYPNP